MKYILLFYTSSLWCTGCADYYDTVKRAVLVSNIDQCCDIQYIDVSINPPVYTREITNLPTIIITDDTGQEQARTSGFKSGKALVDWLRFRLEP